MKHRLAFVAACGVAFGLCGSCLAAPTETDLPPLVRLSRENAFLSRDAAQHNIQERLKVAQVGRSPVLNSGQKNTMRGVPSAPTREQLQRDTVDVQKAFEAATRLIAASNTITLTPKTPMSDWAAISFISPSELSADNSMVRFQMNEDPGTASRVVGQLYDNSGAPGCYLHIAAKKAATYVVSIERPFPGQKGTLAVTLLRNGAWGPGVFETLALELPLPTEGVSKFVVTTQGADSWDGWYTLGLRNTQKGDSWAMKSLTIRRVK